MMELLLLEKLPARIMMNGCFAYNSSLPVKEFFTCLVFRPACK